MNVRLYDSFDDADVLRDVWDRWAGDNFALSWAWLSNWWRTMSDEPRQKLILIAVETNSGQPVAIAPFYRNNSFRGRSLRFLGDGMTCSDYIRILCEPGQESSAGRGVADWIASEDFLAQCGGVDWIELEGHTDNDLGWQGFRNRLNELRWSWQSTEIEGTWAASLPEDWATFYKPLSKLRKRKTKKARKLLEAGEIDFRALASTQEVDGDWDSFVALHQRRRNQIGQPGCFAEPRFFQFLRSTTQQLAADDRVRLFRLGASAQAIGYLLTFVAGNKLAIYQSGFEPEFDEMEPGHLINTFSIQFAIQNKFSSYDFLRGDELYKSGWNGVRTALFRSRCVCATNCVTFQAQDVAVRPKLEGSGDTAAGAIDRSIVARQRVIAGRMRC